MQQKAKRLSSQLQRAPVRSGNALNMGREGEGREAEGNDERERGRKTRERQRE